MGGGGGEGEGGRGRGEKETHLRSQNNWRKVICVTFKEVNSS